MNSEAINEMTRAIISSREFCGNEREAAIEACFESIGRRPKGDEIRAAMGRADAKWQTYQVAAGVAAKYCDGRGGLHDPRVTAALEAE